MNKLDPGSLRVRDNREKPILDNNSSFIIIGKFGKPHGIKGYIKAYAISFDHQALIQYDPWYIETAQGFQAITVDDKKLQDRVALVHIENINTPEKAKLYAGKSIAIKRDQLPKLPPDEYYWSDLEGMTVINEQNETLGIVDHLIETGSNDVMVVLGDKKHLIPFAQDRIVKSIDLKHKIIHVDWGKDF